jgi:3-hydroxyisobutyrate dehydrogenase
MLEANRERLDLRPLSLGWLGLGRMGQSMVRRLLKSGYAVNLWNRTRSKAESLAGQGATIVDTKQDLAGCDIVFTMVSTTEDLKQVLFDGDGLIGSHTRPKLVVDSSSISQEGSAEIRRRLEATGVNYLCAPVSGNAKVVNAGKLLIVSSGPKVWHNRAEPYLQAMARKVVWVGEGERARTWKIAHNTMLGVFIQSLCEIAVLAEKAGIPRHVFLESINESVLGSMYTRYKTPALVNLTFDQVTFTPGLLLKDMDLGMAAAKAYGVAMPAAAASRESVARLIGRGHKDVDFAVLLLEVARDAGLELKPEDRSISDGLEPE